MWQHIDPGRTDELARVAAGTVERLADWGSPELYSDVDPAAVRDFLHVLDVIETLLLRVQITVRVSTLAMLDLERATLDSLAGDFWGIEVEEYFASVLLDLCYQLKNSWTRLAELSADCVQFGVMRGPAKGLPAVALARHLAVHSKPWDFEHSPLAQERSFLHRPHQVVLGCLEKEPAHATVARRSALVRDSVAASCEYIASFAEAVVPLHPQCSDSRI